MKFVFILAAALIAVQGCAVQSPAFQSPEQKAAAIKKYDDYQASLYEKIGDIDEGWPQPVELSISTSPLEVNHGAGGDESKAFTMSMFQTKGEHDRSLRIFRLGVFKQDCKVGTGTAGYANLESYGMGPIRPAKFTRGEKTLVSTAVDTLCKRAWHL